MQHPHNHIFEMTPDRLREFITEQGMPAFSAKQILRWVYEQTVADPASMSNLSKRDRARLTDKLALITGEIVRAELASDGTQKLLIRWQEPRGKGERSDANGADGRDGDFRNAAGDVSLSLARPETATTLETECVMIPARRVAGTLKDGRIRRTACISSQVGCPVRCAFCASGLGGLDGNLSAGRIVEQVWRLNELLGRGTTGKVSDRITNIVFMGMGEPLSNYTAVIEAVRILIAEWAFNISARKITISTVGMPAGIRRLAREQLPITLALSLHAPNDDIRRELIPWAEYASIEELMDACREYFDLTGREITFEYTMMAGVNDQPEHARQLARIVRTVRGNVNLIRYNEVADLPFGRPSNDVVHEFQSILRSKKVNVHIRASRGRDISAACGQLRHEARQE